MKALLIISFVFINLFSADEFKRLSDFDSISSFENYYNKYTQDCLDTRMSDTQGKKCFVSDKLWAIEAKYYYGKLHKELDENTKKYLDTTNKYFEQYETNSMFTVFGVNEDLYQDEGTMFELVAYENVVKLQTEIIKANALWLKNLYEIKTNGDIK